MTIRIGTSGFSFADWIGPFYPVGLKREALLEFYATQFDCVEINSTYYGIPAPGTFAKMAARTPPEFRFVVKAAAVVTHERTADAAADDAFRRACEPLADAGKFEGTLVQFPWAFQNDAAAQAYLRDLRARLPEGPVFVEFRHRSWAKPSTLALLDELGLGYCCVDEPALPSLMPGDAYAVGARGYVRLHGRNAAKWWKGSNSERYDYEYSEPQLAEWAGKIRGLAGRATTTYVFFNNCHAGQAARNAKLLKTLLAGNPRN